MSRLPALNQDLAIEIDYLRLLRRKRIINAHEFEREKKKIIAKQEKFDEEERQRRLQVAFLKREAEKKQRMAEKRLLKRVNVVFNRIVSEDVFPDIIDAWRSTDRFGVLRVITPRADFEIINMAQSKDFIRQFYVSGNSEGNLIIEPGERLLIVAPSRIPAQRIRQLFREGITHCVFTPILTKLKAGMEACKSKDSEKRYKQRINKLADLEELYSAGVPEDKMEDVARASGFKIIIHNILGKDMMVFNEKGKMGVIRLTNTRLNHVEEGHITLDQDYEIVDAKTIVKLWKETRSNNEFYMIEGDIRNDVPRKLRLLNKAYKIVDTNEEYFDDMNEHIDLPKYRFNATKYPEVNEFIKAGRIINAWACPFTDDKPTGHLDMPKAYTQFKKCDYYDGFLGVIHQWRSGSFNKDWISSHIGMYRFRVVSCNNALFQKLGMIMGSEHILPSPEILYFMDNGVVVEIDAGVWGSKFDFDFPDEMLADRRYCLWSGRLGMERTTRNFSFHANNQWASHLKSEFGNDCFYWEDKKVCSVRLPVKNIFTTHHIFAFITSYVRIQMMEAMSKFEMAQLVRVVLDGIYFVGECPMGLEWFREKDIKEYSNNGFEWYSGCDSMIDFPSVVVSGNTLMTGQGGAGKTYKIMTDTGFNRILFVTPQHILGADVMDKYGVSYTTINKLIGEDCQPYHSDHSYPPVLFVDEITQIESSWIERIFNMYKESLIILAGDMDSKGQWFQCRNGRPGMFSSIWKPHDVDVMCIEGDRRSRDDKLRQLKIDLRGIMSRCFIDGDSGEDLVMKMWAKKHLNMISFDNAIKKFEKGDVWIAGTHKTSEKLLENDVVSGWYKTGGFVKFEETPDYKKRGSFTIHSFQGRTLETGKIFISVGDLFEYAMLYTAISRAVSFSQLVFVA